MSPFLQGFAGELSKVAGALGSIARTAIKHPMLTLSALGTAAATGLSASSAYKEGLRGGEKPRYLAAGKEGASPAAYANYNQLFERPAGRKQVRDLSKYYRESKFKR